MSLPTMAIGGFVVAVVLVVLSVTLINRFARGD
jgi:hypothetical protein